MHKASAGTRLKQLKSALSVMDAESSSKDHTRSCVTQAYNLGE